MYIDQISVFVENQPGAAAAVTEVLNEAKINIRALCLSDTSNFGVMRMILDDPGKAFEALRQAHLTITSTPVLAVKLNDSSGGLNRVLRILGKMGCTVEYAYAFIARSPDAAVAILRIDGDDPAVPEALGREGIDLWSEEEMLANLEPVEFFD